jgi:hypothetical protein
MTRTHENTRHNVYAVAAIEWLFASFRWWAMPKDKHLHALDADCAVECYDRFKLAAAKAGVFL